MSDMVATVGLIGDPIKRSLSAALHNAAFAVYGLPDRYTLWPTSDDELQERIATLRQPPLRGANVTIPHKLAVMPLLDSLDPTAEAIGAVNTIVRQSDGKLHGLNTDSAGFRAALIHINYEPRGQQVVLLGAGGAARAVAHALIESRVAQLTVANRTLDHAEALLADLLAATTHDPALLTVALDDPQLADALATADLIVNATSLGGDDQTTPIPAAWLRPHHLVYDLIYHETPLLRTARVVGARAEDGLEMLVQQAALAFTAWTGQSAPIAVMRQAGYQARDDQTR